MPAPRKPTSVLEASGAFKHDPQRRRPHEPDSGPLGEPPAHLSEAVRVIWLEMAAFPVFQRSDRTFLEVLATLMHEFRTNPQMTSAKSQILLTMLSRCGMSPADRSRVEVRTEPPADRPLTGLARFRK